MGMIQNILGVDRMIGTVGRVVKDTAEVFHVNETSQMKAGEERYQAALDQYQAEYQIAKTSVFGQFVDGLNRLPRPLMAFATLGLFSFAMIDPDAFAARMQGLALVPDPLWWLLGAIVGFYFGAREMHHFRMRHPIVRTKAKTIPGDEPREKTYRPPSTKSTIHRVQKTGNPAIDEWLKLNTK